TPPPTLVRRIPDSTSPPVDLEEVLYAEFDQEIDRQAVLGTIKVTDDKSHPIALRLATENEIEANRLVRTLSAKADPKRWIAFRREGKLPAATPFTVRFGPGVPSAEGPKKTTVEQSYSFATYGPMRLTETRCGWSPACTPLAPWSLFWTNPIDNKAFSKS